MLVDDIQVAKKQIEMLMEEHSETGRKLRNILDGIGRLEQRATMQTKVNKKRKIEHSQTFTRSVEDILDITGPLQAKDLAVLCIEKGLVDKNAPVPEGYVSQKIRGSKRFVRMEDGAWGLKKWL